jgi:hypothetical protein
MTYAVSGAFRVRPPVSGAAYDAINDMISCYFSRSGHAGADQADVQVRIPTALKKRLRIIQDAISEVSMHLPSGFAIGLNRQFANMMDEDAWEGEDELTSPVALNAFILLLRETRTMRRPGIGTNGRGSVTAAWTVGENRLTAECLPTGKVSLIVSRRTENGEIERAAFSPMRPERVREILGPFKPEVWFDG